MHCRCRVEYFTYSSTLLYFPHMHYSCRVLYRQTLAPSHTLDHHPAYHKGPPLRMQQHLPASRILYDLVSRARSIVRQCCGVCTRVCTPPSTLTQHHHHHHLGRHHPCMYDAGLLARCMLVVSPAWKQRGQTALGTYSTVGMRCGARRGVGIMVTSCRSTVSIYRGILLVKIITLCERRMDELPFSTMHVVVLVN